MQRVQPFIRFTAEPTITRTRCRFGSQRLLETLWAWLTRLPNTGALPQTSHIFAIDRLLKPQITPGGRDCTGRTGSAQPRAETGSCSRNLLINLNAVELTLTFKGCNFNRLSTSGASLEK